MTALGPQARHHLARESIRSDHNQKIPRHRRRPLCSFARFSQWKTRKFLMPEKILPVPCKREYTGIQLSDCKRSTNFAKLELRVRNWEHRYHIFPRLHFWLTSR